ncbi:hypothetical protein CCC_00756 [Paramagnetospirillum magnetotacticum MS-1]|uniref:TPR/glycosyl transferase domain protein n=1 Tax=Paramagnetospirillum magnetotacticum MS-1 TaxID=272627 RepID=A0A0C2YSJ8_PARME|nr:hypothetical protein [Paramagnetospirillum magnetotacticum]KIL97695.1 hypothetical protein CCC_00756 [Paramagnetospirillum magnetotacticum MS-1]
MRAVLVNHCHPDTPHVCATRMARFAEALAARGHQVVLLTETLEGHPADYRPEDLAAALGRHDWASPFRLAIAPRRDRLLSAFREGHLPAVLRKAVAAGYYLIRGGVFSDWRDGSRPFWPVLAKAFRPQVVWATFGNTDALAIGRGIAALAGCPWVMDVKDPWSVFIPAPIRGLLARRFGDFAALTALSPDHAEDAVPWFGTGARVVHSGIGDGLLAPMPPAGDERRLLLLGGLYGQAELEELLAGVGRWQAGRPLTLTYAGSETARFLDAAGRLVPGAVLEAPGWRTLGEIRDMAARSWATLYVRTPRALFQHKLFELIALARPMICLPPEGGDAQRLAARLGGVLLGCSSAQEVAAALETCPQGCAPDLGRLAQYGWGGQAAVLETLFQEQIER